MNKFFVISCVFVVFVSIASAEWRQTGQSGSGRNSVQQNCNRQTMTVNRNQGNRPNVNQRHCGNARQSVQRNTHAPHQDNRSNHCGLQSGRSVSYRSYRRCGRYELVPAYTITRYQKVWREAQYDQYGNLLYEGFWEEIPYSTLYWKRVWVE